MTIRTLKNSIAFALALSQSIAIATTIEQVDISNLDQVLRQSENAFTDIVTGAEKHVRWFEKQRIQREYSIVYIHGFSASGKEVSPMIERLADKIQANLYYSRLQGHGRSSLDAMGDATLDNWKNEAMSALNIGQSIGEKTILIGTSTGATLITWLNAQENAKSVHATVMISPNFGVKSRLAGLIQWSWLRWLVKQTQGEYRSFQPYNDYHAKYWTTRYPVDALLPMLDLVDEVQGLDMSKITSPQLAIYSPNDQIVNVEKTRNALKKMVNAKVVSQHYTDTSDPVQHLLVGMVSTSKQTDNFVELIYNNLREWSNKNSD